MNGEIHIRTPRMLADGGVELSACLRIGMKRWKQYLLVRGNSLHFERLDNSGDVWTILFLHKMMEYGGHYKVRGAVSASLLSGLDRYVTAWANMQPAAYAAFTLEPDVIKDDSGRTLLPGCLACFSGGLDACFTAFRHARGMAGAQNQQLEACLMVRGADIRKDREAEWEEASRTAKELVDDLEIPQFYTVETNFRDMHCAYGMSYFSMLVACMRVFGREYGHLMLGSDNCFNYFHLASGNNPVTNHFLSSHGVEVITDGSDYTRTEKAAVVAQWPLALQKLRVCYQGDDLSCNCGECGKCKRTRLNFLAVGVRELPCMPPLQSEDELLDFTMTPVEQLEISLLLEYLDAHPLKPVPLWETRLRAMMDNPPDLTLEKRSLSRYLVQWCGKVAACMGMRLFGSRKDRYNRRIPSNSSTFVRASRGKGADASSGGRH